MLFLMVSELKIGTQPVGPPFGEGGVVAGVEAVLDEGAFWASLPRRKRSNFLPILRPHVNTFLLSLQGTAGTLEDVGGGGARAGSEMCCWSSSSTMTGTAVTTL